MFSHLKHLVGLDTPTPAPKTPPMLKAPMTIPAPAAPTTDATSPNYYARFKIQPLDFILANGIGFCEGNVIKYVCRYDGKNGLEDLQKARTYLDRLIADASARQAPAVAPAAPVVTPVAAPVVAPVVAPADAKAAAVKALADTMAARFPK